MVSYVNTKIIHDPIGLSLYQKINPTDINEPIPKRIVLDALNNLTKESRFKSFINKPILRISLGVLMGGIGIGLLLSAYFVSLISLKIILGIISIILITNALDKIFDAISNFRDYACVSRLHEVKYNCFGIYFDSWKDSEYDSFILQCDTNADKFDLSPKENQAS